MEPNNISDIIENMMELQTLTVQQEELLRHQIEQLLGKIDTHQIEIVESKRSRLFNIFTGKNKKSSEIANQIKLMKQ